MSFRLEIRCASEGCCASIGADIGRNYAAETTALNKRAKGLGWRKRGGDTFCPEHAAINWDGLLDQLRKGKKIGDVCALPGMPSRKDYFGRYKTDAVFKATIDEINVEKKRLPPETWATLLEEIGKGRSVASICEGMWISYGAVFLHRKEDAAFERAYQDAIAASKALRAPLAHQVAVELTEDQWTALLNDIAGGEKVRAACRKIRGASDRKIAARCEADPAFAKRYADALEANKQALKHGARKQGLRTWECDGGEALDFFTFDVRGILADAAAAEKRRAQREERARRTAIAPETWDLLLNHIAGGEKPTEACDKVGVASVKYVNHRRATDEAFAARYTVALTEGQAKRATAAAAERAKRMSAAKLARQAVRDAKRAEEKRLRRIEFERAKIQRAKDREAERARKAALPKRPPGPRVYIGGKRTRIIRDRPTPAGVVRASKPKASSRVPEKTVIADARQIPVTLALLAERFQVPERIISERKRHGAGAGLPRDLFRYLVIVELGNSTKAFERATGIENSTIANTLAKIEDRRDDPVFDAMVDELAGEIRARLDRQQKNAA